MDEKLWTKGMDEYEKMRIRYKEYNRNNRKTKERLLNAF